MCDSKKTIYCWDFTENNLRWRLRRKSCGSSSTSSAPRWWSPRLAGKKHSFMFCCVSIFHDASQSWSAQKNKNRNREVMLLKKSEIICKYEVFPFGCSSSELFMRRGIMTMQPLWIKRLHSLHFRGGIHYPSMEKVYQRMEWTERRWDDQMYRRRTFSDSSQRGRRLQPSEYEWDGDRALSKVCPTTGRSNCRHSRTTFWGKTAAKSPPGRYVTMWWKAPARSALACLKGFLHAKESSYTNPCQHDWWLISWFL